jgi:hypothetical protein
MNRHVLDPRMSADPIDLRTQIGFELVERAERQINVGARSGRNVPPDLVITEGEHPAARMLDDNDLLGAKKLLADDKRADRVVGSEPAGIADNVGRGRSGWELHGVADPLRRRSLAQPPRLTSHADSAII